ncbi:MAG: choice-of-anchor V domain-containing protein [Bacteroidia bacterium]
MKTKLLSTAIVLCAIAFILHDAYSAKGGKAGYTGSPSENTCLTSGCHVGNPLNAAPGSVVISSPDLTNFIYTPGHTYTINVTVSKTGVGLFGFAMEALKSNGGNAGSFVHTSPTVTQSLSVVVAGQVRTSATHKLNAGLATGSKTFAFNWVAPNPGVGTVTFYAAGNAANNNNNTSGDFIYTTNHAVLDSTIVAGINEPTVLLENVNVFPNPVSSLLNVSLNTKEKADLKIEVYNLAGQFQDLLLLKTEAPGSHQYSFEVNQRFVTGMYLLRVTSGNQTAIKKVFFQ